MSENVEYFQTDKDIWTHLLNMIRDVKNYLDISIGNDNLHYFIQNTDFITGCKGLLKKGVEIRCILQSPSKNAEEYKQILDIASKVKYLEGIEGITAISDTEYFHSESDPVNSQNHRVSITKNKFVLSLLKKSFDTLFQNAVSYLETSAQNRDEFNIFPPSLKFKVDVEISDQIIHFLDNSKFICIYSTIGGMLLGYQTYLDHFKEILAKFKVDQHSGIRWITCIKTKSDIRLVKDMLQMGVQIRHISDSPPFDFAISDKYFACTVERNEERKLIIDNLLLNDNQANLTFYNMIFEKLWESSMDANDKISEMQRDKDDNIVVVTDSNECLHKLFELFTLAKKDVLIILPSINGFFRTEMSGGFKMMDRIGAKGIQIRILTLPDLENMVETRRIKAKYTNIGFRDLEQPVALFNRIMIFDREDTLIWEVKDDSQLKYTDALGKAIFIEGIRTSEAIASIFDSLWNHSEIHNRLKEAHEKVKVHDKMQSRFMDLVAHELRTPLQSMLGITELLKANIKNNDQNFMLRIMMSNAKKLQRLSESILDITRLEGNVFNLNKEEFSFNKLVKTTIADYVANTEYNKSIEFEFKNFDKEYVVKADKFRIAQVIQNLSDNSVRFTKNNGKIVLTLSEKRIHAKEIVVLSVTDYGERLKPELLSRLFTKFSSDSYYGVGIGLYLCKKIIETHEGRIWAINNKNENGCTFSFGIPKKD